MNTKDNLCDFILFGGHGDLAFRKLMPALFHLCKDEYLASDSRVITVSRRDMNNFQHIELVKEKLIEFLPKKVLLKRILIDSKKVTDSNY